MLSENVQVLDQYPECTLQQSANFPDSSAPAKAAQVNNVVFLRIHSIMLCSPRGSPRIRKFKTVGFWNPRHGFWIPGTRSCIPCQWNLILDSNVQWDSGFLELNSGFHKPKYAGDWLFIRQVSVTSFLSRTSKVKTSRKSTLLSIHQNKIIQSKKHTDVFQKPFTALN